MTENDAAPIGKDATPPLPVKPAKPKRRRKWLRRLVWIAASVALAVVVLRYALVLALPSILEKVAAKYDLRCTYERLDVTFIGLDAELWHLVLAPKEGGEPFVDAEYCRADVAVLELFRGRLVVRRIDSDGLDLLVERNADGKIPLLERLSKGGGPAPAPKAEPPPAPPPPAGDIALVPPVEIDALRVDRLRAHIRDLSPAPPIDTRLELDLRLSDLASRIRPARFEVRLSSKPVLDSLLLTGELKGAERALEASFQVAVQGFHPRELAGYLEPMGLKPVAEEITFGMGARLEAEKFPVPDPEEGKPGHKKKDPQAAIKAGLVVSGIRAAADGGETFAVDRIAIDAPFIQPASIHLGRILVQGIRAEATRSPAGLVRAGGFELVPARPAPPPPPKKEPPGAPIALRIDEVLLDGLCARIEDEAIDPPQDLAIGLEKLSLKNVALDPRDPEAVMEIAGRLEAPGLLREATIIGRARPFAPLKSLDLSLQASGIHRTAAGPYLRAAGLEPTFEDGSLALDLHALLLAEEPGHLVAEARLEGVRLEDKDELLVLDHVRLSGIDLEPEAARIGLEEIEVAGPKLAAAREASGALSFLGLRTISPGPPLEKVGEEPKPSAPPPPPPPAAEMKPSPASPAAGSPASPAPRIAIKRFLWMGLRVDVTDAAMEPPARLALEDAGLEITDLVVDLDPAAPPPAPGKLRGWASAQGIAGFWTASGKLVASPRTPSMDLDIAGKAIAPSAIAAHLRAMGVESTLKDGSLRLHLGAQATIAPGALTAALAVEKLAFEDGGTELLGLDAFRVKGASIAPGEIAIEAIEIEKPRAAAARDEDGALIVSGLRIPKPKPASVAPAPPPAAAAPPVAAASPSEEPPAAAPREAAANVPALPAIVLKSLRLSQASLQWADRAVNPAVGTAATVSASLDGLTVGRDAAPAAFKVSLRLDGALEDLTASGKVSTAARGLEATIDVDSSGIRAGPLAAYLPEGTAVSLKDGRFRARIEAGVAPHVEGGLKGRFIVSGVEFRDGQDGKPLFALEDFRVLLARLDLPSHVVAVDEVSSAGLEMDVERTASGGVRLLGVTLEPPAPPAAAGDRSTEPAAQEPAPPAGAPSEKPRARTGPLPLVTLRKLDLNLRRMTLTDASRPGSAPVALTAIRLASPSSIEVLGDEPEGRPPVKIELTGGVAPVVGAFRVAVELSPFAVEPGLKLDVSADGIRGAGVNEAVPELKDRLDGAPLADGRFQAHLETRFMIQRRSPVSFDVSRGVGLDFLLKDVEFRDGASGPVLAGLGELRIEGVKAEPAAGTVRVRSVEVVKPAGRVLRDKDGIHILNLVVKLPPPATQVAGAEVKVEKAKDEAPPAPAAAPQPPPAPGAPAAAPAKPRPGESRIDRLVLSGIDFTVEDRTADPPMIIPITGLEGDVKNISTRVLTEDQDIRFGIYLKSGKAPLPGKEAGKFEDRMVFEEIALSGDLALHPTPRGWVKAGVGSLDLATFKGPASQAGVTIGGGLFDTAVNVRFQGDGSLETGSRTTFTDLSMSEAAGGPLSSVLGLSAPLETVIFLLRNESGSIKVPLNVKVGAAGVSLAEISRLAIVTLSEQITKAVINSPFRMVSPVTGLLIIGKGAEAKLEDSEPTVLRFPAGDAGLAPDERTKLEPILKKLRGDPTIQVTLLHEVGADDLARASVLANPTPADASLLVARLGRRKAELLETRGPAAARARGAIAAGVEVQVQQATADLRAIDRELARTEDALDRIYDVLRPGAERQAVRRTREACIAFGRDRIEAVRATLRESKIDGLDGRIRVVPVRSAENAEPGGGRVTVIMRRSAPTS